MLLTTANAASYLLARRLIAPASVVDDDFMAIDTSRRNRNVEVRWRDGAGLFLKQIQSADPQDITALRREASCYALPQQHAGLEPLAAIMPRLRFYDPTANILTIDLIPECENLYRFHKRTRTWPLDVAQSLGDALARLHGPRIVDILDASERSRLFSRTPAWILSAHEMNPSTFNHTVSPANRQLFELVQRHPGFAEALTSLRDQWHSDTLIHGDMKWDNCVLTWPNGSDGNPQVTFVDWELADIGDPSWDIGALLQAYLSEWISSIPQTAGASQQDFSRLAATPLESLHPSIAAFWTRYIEKREIEPAEQLPVLERAVRCAGARMIQTAYETLSFAQSLTPNMVLLLQVSLNVLTRPQEARAQLFALP